MKKFLALVLVGVLTVGTAVMAAPSRTAADVPVPQVEASGSPSSSVSDLEQAAKEDGMSVQEESNNALVDADTGISPADAITAGVPQGTLINGQMTAFSIRIKRGSKTQIDMGKKIAVAGKTLRRVLILKNKPAGNVVFNVYLPQGSDGVVAYQYINGQAVQLTTAKIADNKISVAVTVDAPIYLFK